MIRRDESLDDPSALSPKERAELCRDDRDEALDNVCRLRGELFALRESLGKSAPDY